MSVCFRAAITIIFKIALSAIKLRSPPPNMDLYLTTSNLSLNHQLSHGHDYTKTRLTIQHISELSFAEGTASPKEFTDWLYQQSNIIENLSNL